MGDLSDEGLINKLVDEGILEPTPNGLTLTEKGKQIEKEDAEITKYNLLLMYEKTNPKLLTKKAKHELSVIHEMIDDGVIAFTEENGLVITNKGIAEHDERERGQ